MGQLRSLATRLLEFLAGSRQRPAMATAVDHLHWDRAGRTWAERPRIA